MPWPVAAGVIGGSSATILCHRAGAQLKDSQAGLFKLAVLSCGHSQQTPILRTGNVSRSRHVQFIGVSHQELLVMAAEGDPVTA